MSDRPATIVGIDTNVLIYALRTKFADNDEKENTRRAKNLMRHLLDQSTLIHVSVITVAEYLVKIPDSQVSSSIRELETWLHIAPFNLHAAQLAAKLFRLTSKHSRIGIVANERTILRADTKIIASLQAINVQTIYTNDSHFCDTANLVVKGMMLPDRITLLDDQE